MALLLDVSPARPHDPAALRSALRRAGLPPTVTLSPLPRTAPRLRLHRWRLGDGAALARLESTGIAVRARPDTAAVARIAVAVFSPGEWTLAHHRVLTPTSDEPTLVLIDGTAPLDFRRTGSGTVLLLQVDVVRLALPRDVPHRAVRRLRPGDALAEVVRAYLLQLATVASTDPELLPELHVGTMELVRALLLGAAGDPAADVADPSRRIRDYIAEHLDDPALGAETIAAAANISVRQLYKVWAGTGTGLADHIIALRLARARETLRTHRHLTVAAVAHRHGFTDATHFARRFRAAYAMSPTEWRRGALVDQG
ncbi:helix-turn-helix domain-containing protein [Nocardia sp. NPDC057353]|uniref:helix-turn-helix domain-containing protein n=1 Tax=Nocardia sp. NPDC057353 TaxID=3346104 RepID=UPI003634033E